jgi:hypothetical protein
MMKKTLADLWRETTGHTVTFEGVTVHAIIFREVRESGRLVVRFLDSRPKPIQALRIDIDPGQLLVQGEAASKMILRLDTSPTSVEVHYRAAGQGSRIALYNAWIDENGQIDRWTMHAGMLVEETGNKMLLRCSDGRGEPTFDDLVVEIEFLDD